MHTLKLHKPTNVNIAQTRISECLPDKIEPGAERKIDKKNNDEWIQRKGRQKDTDEWNFGRTVDEEVDDNSIQEKADERVNDRHRQ